MILLDNNGVAVRRNALRLTDSAAIGLGWVAPDFNEVNASLLDQPEPQPWVAGAWRWDGQQWAEEKPDLIDAIRNPPFDQAAAWEQIKRIRDRKTQGGGYLAAGKWFHSDTFSRTQQIGLTLMGANVPPGLMWKTMDGSFVEMTPTLAQQVFAAAGQQDAALFSYAEQLRAQVAAAQDPASIDLEAGWPETFGGV